MNRCLRSLSCLLTVIALALCATNAAARTNPKQQHAKKTPEKKTHEKKLHAAKEARPLVTPRLKNAGTRNMPMRKRNRSVQRTHLSPRRPPLR